MILASVSRDNKHLSGQGKWRREKRDGWKRRLGRQVEMGKDRKPKDKDRNGEKRQITTVYKESDVSYCRYCAAVR